jgi:hypothetical protein
MNLGPALVVYGGVLFVSVSLRQVSWDKDYIMVQKVSLSDPWTMDIKLLYFVGLPSSETIMNPKYPSMSAVQYGSRKP